MWTDGLIHSTPLVRPVASDPPQLGLVTVTVAAVHRATMFFAFSSMSHICGFLDPHKEERNIIGDYTS